ncbi:hypothetical protein niasHS_010626 [Heterodera schachtii]|uniref:Uncharacterized protein n=1 Tax=Heterodera schachtii TaxID=97005 RepID=A0ABD2IS44_HETSC
MIGLCNIPPGSPLFGVDVFSARPHFVWDNAPSSSICERFEQQWNNSKSARKMLCYLRDGRKILEGKVTEPQSSDLCWKQTLLRSRLIAHTREMLLDGSRKEQMPQSLPFSKAKHSNASLIKGLAQCKSKKTQKGRKMPKSNNNSRNNMSLSSEFSRKNEDEKII